MMVTGIDFRLLWHEDRNLEEVDLNFHHNGDEPDASTRQNSPLNKQEQEEMITQFAEPITSEETQPETGSADARFPELSNKLEKDLVQVFKLLADETRLKILFYLGREKELHVSALCERLNQSQPAVSHHLALLRVAGLIEPRRDGKHNYYSLQQSRFHGIVGQLFNSITEDSNASEFRFDDFIFRQER